DDGIRDRNVTGVQTCALPIFSVPKVPFVLNENLVNRSQSTYLHLYKQPYSSILVIISLTNRSPTFCSVIRYLLFYQTYKEFTKATVFYSHLFFNILRLPQNTNMQFIFSVKSFCIFAVRSNMTPSC